MTGRRPPEFWYTLAIAPELRERHPELPLSLEEAARGQLSLSLRSRRSPGSLLRPRLRRSSRCSPSPSSRRRSSHGQGQAPGP